VLEQHGADQSGDGVLAGEDDDTVGASFNLAD
jgi:hypothetical protein